MINPETTPSSIPYRFSKKNCARILCLCLLALALTDCQQGQAPEEPAVLTTSTRPPGCQGCHPELQLDPNHNLACTDCHRGNSEAATQGQAHTDLISKPAHPEQMQKFCGSCHARQVSQAATSLHFSARNEVNVVRAAFGAKIPLASLSKIPIPDSIVSPLDLADDLLRRRCLRCHVYSSGDGYPETVRGTGCAACHLSYGNGKMTDHAFNKSPADSQCLHCHYGNFVGADFYGRFEHDFNLEYRTPYRTNGTKNRLYGVESHQLAPDIHQQKGLACIDCHSGAELMGRHGAARDKIPAITCLACHGWRKGSPIPLSNLHIEANQLVLTTRLSGKKLLVPKPIHPAHRQYEKIAHCTVCHSQWSFNDQGTHLLRTGQPDAEVWSRFTVQGSREVEEQLDNPVADVPVLKDKITGTPSKSLWLKGYGLRRWENPLVGVGPDGKLQIFRPILDLHLSMIAPGKKVIFDNVGVEPVRQRYRPYIPHTVGKAGAFFSERLKPNLPTETKP